MKYVEAAKAVLTGEAIMAVNKAFGAVKSYDMAEGGCMEFIGLIQELGEAAKVLSEACAVVVEEAVYRVQKNAAACGHDGIYCIMCSMNFEKIRLDGDIVSCVA